MKDIVFDETLKIQYRKTYNSALEYNEIREGILLTSTLTPLTR